MIPGCRELSTLQDPGDQSTGRAGSPAKPFCTNRPGIHGTRSHRQSQLILLREIYMLVISPKPPK